MTERVIDAEVAVIGAGSVGLSVAYYLVKDHGVKRVVLVDAGDPMGLTSAQSGENYRNWWPHPVMTAFTDHSTQLMEAIDCETEGRLNMTRGGYSLVTRRSQPQDLISDLFRGYGASPQKIRIHEAHQTTYQAPVRQPWQGAPDGVDVLLNQSLIRKTFPTYAQDVAAVIHIRRAGSFSSQQLGQYMLEIIRQGGGVLLRGSVKAIQKGGAGFAIEISGDCPDTIISAQKVVNAAGPYLRDVACMLGEDLNVQCVYQQKISFEDREGAVPRDMPFTIDLDPTTLAWSDEDRQLLQDDPATRHLVEPMSGGIHCRPDGAVSGRWIKLGWAYNQVASDPHAEDPIDPHFPDTVLRGASRLHPKLAAYIGKLPRGAHHYGGYYTMTTENWPLIGPMQSPGAFVAGALSGFGSMAACATGHLCAAWVMGSKVPDYAHSLTSKRYGDQALMSQLEHLSKGSL